MISFNDALTLDVIRDYPDRNARICLMVARRIVRNLWEDLYHDTTGVYGDLMHGDRTWMADLEDVEYAIRRVFTVLNRDSSIAHRRPPLPPTDSPEVPD